jgi:hypothetical protein
MILIVVFFLIAHNSGDILQLISSRNVTKSFTIVCWHRFLVCFWIICSFSYRIRGISSRIICECIWNCLFIPLDMKSLNRFLQIFLIWSTRDGFFSARQHLVTKIDEDLQKNSQKLLQVVREVIKFCSWYFNRNGKCQKYSWSWDSTQVTGFLRVVQMNLPEIYDSSKLEQISFFFLCGLF